MGKFCRVEHVEGGRELWMDIREQQEDTDSVQAVKVVTWTFGEANLVVTIPHAGTIGSDTTAAGHIYCQSGNVIQTRIGTNQHPIRTYTRDAGTDVIGHQLAKRLGKTGLSPHVVECHVHRSKVECNRSIEEVAVDKLGEEAQEIFDTYHAWITEAIGMCRQVGENVPGVFLLDLHGHGHPHDYIELGYRLTADTLNAIADEENSRSTWNSVMTSAARHEFTLRHLVKRKFSPTRVEEAVLGPTSLAACLNRQLEKCEDLKEICCIPSQEKKCPGKLGFYIGAHTVRLHSAARRVDCAQIELPLSVRSVRSGASPSTGTAPPAAAGDQIHPPSVTTTNHPFQCGDSAGSGTTQPAYAVAQAIADGLLEFYNHHYKPSGAQEDSHNSDDSDIGESDPIVTAALSLPPPSTLLPPPPPPPPRPPPPPPPPAVVAASRHGDGISHMAMMAKSRMHEELVNKANAMTLNHTANNKHSTAMEKEEEEAMLHHTSTITTNNNTINTTTTTELLDDTNSTDTSMTVVDRHVVSNKVKHIETRLEEHSRTANGNVNQPETQPLISNGGAAENGGVPADVTDGSAVSRTATTPNKSSQAYSKSKLYDSLFAERKLSEKEMKRRQFLFGLQPPPSATKQKPKPVDEPAAVQEQPAEPAKPPSPPPPKVESRPTEPAAEVKKPVKEKRKCCCTIQ